MKWLPLVAACVVASLLVYGCGRDDVAVSLPRTAPLLMDLSVTPQQFEFGGGTATVQVKAESDRGIRAVMAEVTPLDRVDATSRFYPMTITGGNVYQMALPVPSNTTATGQAAQYRIAVTAEDNDGVSSTPGVVILSVDAPDSTALPQPP